ncbi:hypothetical protein AN963_00035 [Brevibacillus choshinensis]|uniref:DUF1453 domain-containing protein n=1 Tax=Brevibacillus choshinensis TaxID=54911 RepID=A0ABR5N9Q1_BRECH|nr:hypothetical protein [Brevibacillus choshinensis]KQL48260.1 hypothetical protein AN963_00035 [Brevibacillus choshinensis]
MADPQLAYFVLVAIIVALVQLRERRVRGWTLWIIPLLLTVATIQDVVVIWYDSVLAPIILILGFGAGLFLGVVRGKMTHIRKNPETGKWTMKGSWGAYLMWIAVFGAGIVTKSMDNNIHLIRGFLLMASLGAVVMRRIWIFTIYKRSTAKK